MQTEEKLLTAEEIASILIEATDPVFSDSRLIVLGLHRLSVVRVSSVGGLVFFKGDEHTGLDHIRLRHSYHSLKRTFQEEIMPNGDRTIRLDDPSRFRPEIGAYSDYFNIADSVFANGQLDILGNKRPDTFDKYKGYFTYNDGKPEKHTLILYKNTNIVHTLFPQRDKNNRPKLGDFPFIRGVVSATWKLIDGIVEIKIPYITISDTIKYTILFEYGGISKTQRIGIWAHNEQGEQFQYLFLWEVPNEVDIKSVYYDFPRQLQYADLRRVEQFIKDTESGIIPFESVNK